MTLERFVAELRAIAAGLRDPRAIVERVRPLALNLAASRSWVETRHYRCDPDQGFGAHLLHEEPDHSLAVIAGAWLPGRGAPPHNHGTWGLVAGVDGSERNTFWTRLDDGSHPGHARIRWQAERVLGPGDVMTFQPDSIHSVVNENDRVSLSLHVYGMHVNHTNRAQFDPATNTERAFILTVD
jgi:predicted metal-dependent enzyme (double-stranded beta helix superfamily)